MAELEISDSENETDFILRAPEPNRGGLRRNTATRVARSLRKRTFRQRHVYTADLARFLKLKSLEELEMMSMAGHSDQAIITELNREYILLKRKNDRANNNHKFKKKSFDSYVEDFKKYMATGTGKTFYDAADEDEGVRKGEASEVDQTEHEQQNDHSEAKTESDNVDVDEDRNSMRSGRSNRVHLYESEHENGMNSADADEGPAECPISEHKEKDISLNQTFASDPIVLLSDEPDVAMDDLSEIAEINDPDKTVPAVDPDHEVPPDVAEASHENKLSGDDGPDKDYPKRLRKRNFEQTHIYTIDLIRHLGLMEESELRYLANANKSETEIHKILNGLFVRKRMKLKERGQLNGYFRNESFYDCLKQDRALLKKRLYDEPNVDSQVLESEASDDPYSSSIEGSQDSVLQSSDSEASIANENSKPLFPEVSVGDRVYRSYGHALRGVLPASFTSLNHEILRPPERKFESQRKHNPSIQDDAELFASEVESEPESSKAGSSDEVDLFGMAEEDYRSGIQRMLNVVRSKRTEPERNLKPKRKFKKQSKRFSEQSTDRSIRRQSYFAKQGNASQRILDVSSFLNRSTDQSNDRSFHQPTHQLAHQSSHQSLRSESHSKNRSTRHPHKYAENHFDYWRKPTVLNPQIETIDLDQVSSPSDHETEPVASIEASNETFNFQVFDPPLFVESNVFKAALSPLEVHFEGDNVSFPLRDEVLVLARFSNNTLKVEKIISELASLWKKRNFDQALILLKKFLEWTLVNVDNTGLLKNLSFLVKKLVQLALCTGSNLPLLGHLSLLLSCLSTLLHKQQEEEVIVNYFQLMLKTPPHELFLLFQSDRELFCSFAIVMNLCKDWRLFNKAAANASTTNVLEYIQFISSYKRPIAENWAIVETIASLDLQEAEVDSLLETVHNEATKCDWVLREKVITKVYTIFSRRKFSNFPRERENLCLQLSVPSEHCKEADSLLMKYLRLLSLYVNRTTNSKRRLLEKITPLSDVQSSSKQTIVNRTNMLLVMSLLFGKDFQSQLTPSIERLLEFGMYNHVFTVLRTLFNVVRPFELLASVLKYCVHLKTTQPYIDKLLDELEFRSASSEFFSKLLPCLLPLFESSHVTTFKVLKLVSRANHDCDEVALEKLLTALRKVVTSTTQKLSSNSERKTASFAIEVWVAVACLLKRSWYQVIYMDWNYAKTLNTGFDDQLDMVFLSEVLKYGDKELYLSESLLFWKSLVSNLVKLHDGSVFVAYYEQLLTLVRKMDPNNPLFGDSSSSIKEQYALRIAIRLCGSSSVDPNSNKLLLTMIMSVKAELEFLEQHQRFRLSSYKTYVTPIIRYMNYTSSRNFLKTCVEFVEIRNKLEIPQLTVSDGFGMLLEDKPGPSKVCEYLQEELITHVIQETTSQFYQNASQYILVKYSNQSNRVCMESSVLFPVCLLISVYSKISGSSVMLSHWFHLLLQLVEQKASAGLGEDDLWCLLKLLRAISSCLMPHDVYGNSLHLFTMLRQSFSTFTDYSHFQKLIHRLLSPSDVISSSLEFHSLCQKLLPASEMLMEKHSDALRDRSSGTMYHLHEALSDLERDLEDDRGGAPDSITFDFFV